MVGQEEAGSLRGTRSTAYISELIRCCMVGRKRPCSFAKPDRKQKCMPKARNVGPVSGKTPCKHGVLSTDTQLRLETAYISELIWCCKVGRKRPGSFVEPGHRHEGYKIFAGPALRRTIPLPYALG
jgi:hypothetical protein